MKEGEIRSRGLIDEELKKKVAARKTSASNS
jgi:hypothetical protein